MLVLVNISNLNPLVADTPSHATWDDDDPTPLKKSSWDLPTPRSHLERGSNSERGSYSERGSHSERGSERRTDRRGDRGNSERSGRGGDRRG